MSDLSILLTGAEESGNIVTNPSESLGGYVSSTVVTSETLKSLFGSLSHYRMSIGDYSDYRCIALKATKDLSKIEIWSEDQENNFAFFEMAFSCPAEDENGNPVFEEIPNGQTSPQLVFTKYDPDNKGVISDVKEGDYIGLWIKRNIKSIKETDNCDIPEDEETINIFIETFDPL